MNQDNIVAKIAVWLVPLVIAIVFHEVAHGLVARSLGDPTASERGRLSFNPIKHVDLFGTVLLPLMLVISQAGAIFGWAKPVPVNYARLRNPRRDMVLVALAGPGMNLLLAIAGAAIGRFSLVVMVLLLLVLPRLSPNADIIGRVVSPIVNSIIVAILGIFGLS